LASSKRSQPNEVDLMATIDRAAHDEAQNGPATRIELGWDARTVDLANQEMEHRGLGTRFVGASDFTITEPED
jgi:hypothetical protein